MSGSVLLSKAVNQRLTFSMAKSEKTSLFAWLPHIQQNWCSQPCSHFCLITQRSSPTKQLLLFQPHSFSNLSQSQLWFYFLELFHSKLSFHMTSNYSLLSIKLYGVELSPRKHLFCKKKNWLCMYQLCVQHFTTVKNFSLISAIFKQRVLHFSWVSYFIIAEENFFSQGVGRILDSYANPWLVLNSPTPLMFILGNANTENIFHCLNVDRSVITKVWGAGISWLLWKGT